MTEKPRVTAYRWKTPFETVDPNKLNLLRVSYPSCPWIHKADGTKYDFSDYTEDGDCEILVFSEVDRTVYRILADASAVRIHDEHDLDMVDDWAPETGRTTMRLSGTHLHRTISSHLNDEEPSYLVATGWDCIEFICLNEPRVEAIGKVEDSQSLLN